METKRFLIKDFENICQQNDWHIPIEILQKDMQLILHGIKYIDIPLSIIDDMKREKGKRDKWESDYSNISSHRIAGINKEKDDDIEGAIKEYKECIDLGEHNPSMFHAYAYAYQRIIILFHKVNDIDSEIKYLKMYLTFDLSPKEKEKYQIRLTKLLSL